MNRFIPHVLLSAASLVLCSRSPALGQIEGYEPCDTTVQGIAYNRCLYSEDQKLAGLANVNHRGRLDGAWFEYTEIDGNRMQVTGQYERGKKDGEWTFRDEDGRFLRSENYSNGTPCGKWWLNSREYVVYNKRGDITSKGSGCRDCPNF